MHWPKPLIPAKRSKSAMRVLLRQYSVVPKFIEHNLDGVSFDPQGTYDGDLESIRVARLLVTGHRGNRSCPANARAV
jgi:hypothetical protein